MTLHLNPHRICTVLVTALFFGVSHSVAASAIAETNGVPLRQLLEQQQAAIQQLLDNQRRQDEEIKALRLQLEAQSQIVSISDKSAVDDSYSLEPELAYREEQEEMASASTPASPLKLLPGGARFSLGGHINRAVNIADDGDSTEAYFVDSGSVPTLSYIKAYLPVNDHLTVGGHIEYALQHNSANAVSQDNQDPGFNTSARNFEITLDSTRYGKLWFGRGFMASFLAVELDKSQTWRYNILSPGNTFGGLKFVDSNNSELSELTVASVFLDAEAFNRKDRIRYDSPVFGGFRLSAATGTADSSDIALRWNRTLGDLDITAAISAQNNPVQGRVKERYDGGIAMFHKRTGLSLTLAGVSQEYKKSFYQNFGRSDGDNNGYALRLGLRRNWFESGETRIALDYFNSDDVLYNGDESQSSGLFISQNIEAWSIEPYIGYRIYDYDTGPNANGLALDDIHVWTMGARMALDLTIQ